MVKPFSFARIPRVIFGCASLGRLPDIVTGYGRQSLIITGARSFVSSSRGGKFFEELRAKGVTIHHVTVPGEPSPESIDEIVARFSDMQIDSVTSIGGGSVVDAGKAVSAMLKADGSVKEYLEVVGTREHSGNKLPFIAVPTTSGTGSEATKNAVISSVGPEGFKRSLRHDNFVPDVAVIDPELTLDCPADITAAAGMDCFTQLTEAYLSVKAGNMTDSLALEGLKAVRLSLLRSFTHGDDPDARSGMSFAALMSGICLANAGLGTVHGLAGTIGALSGIPHGVVCGTLMAVANELNVRELRKSDRGSSALGRYATLGRIYADAESKTDDYYIDFFIDYLHALTYYMKLPRLGSCGLRPDDVNEIVSRSDNKNNPVLLSEENMKEIVLRRI